MFYNISLQTHTCILYNNTKTIVQVKIPLLHFRFGPSVFAAFHTFNIVMFSQYFSLVFLISSSFLRFECVFVVSFICARLGSEHTYYLCLFPYPLFVKAPFSNVDFPFSLSRSYNLLCVCVSHFVSFAIVQFLFDLFRSV